MPQTAIRVKEQIGIVTNDTSTSQLCFLISPLKNRITVEEKEYVLLDHPAQGETSQLLTEVTEIRSYEEIGGTSLNDKTAGNRIAAAKILGYINLQDENKPIHRLLTPPNPGSRVYLPYAEFLADILNRDTEGKPYQKPISLGKIDTTALVNGEKKQAIECYLDAETLTTTHTLIASADGAGKTHTAKIIAKEIADKTQHPIVILDPYGEYAETAKSISKPIQILAPNADGTAKDAAKNVKPNQTTILTAEGLTPKENRILYSQHLDGLWKARLENATPPFLLFIEDAETLKTETLEEIACAGTKHGLTLILIAKHATELGGKILAQTTTQIMGRTNNKDDLEFLASLSGEKAANLPNLKRGQWIISGATMARPMQVQVKEQ